MTVKTDHFPINSLRCNEEYFMIAKQNVKVYSLQNNFNLRSFRRQYSYSYKKTQLSDRLLLSEQLTFSRTGILQLPFWTYHFESLLGPQQVEHGLQVLLDVAAALGAVLARPGPRDQPLIGGQHQRRALAREVAFAQAATTTPHVQSAGINQRHKVVKTCTNPYYLLWSWRRRTRPFHRCTFKCNRTFAYLAQL